jgi:hypothetical protein
MATEHKSSLTSAEIGILWNQYILDTMSLCIEKYALACEQDEQIRSIIQDTITLMENTPAQVSRIFQAEGIPVPEGFSGEDENLEVPSLYSSIFRLQYIKYKANLRMAINGLCLARSSRSDIRNFFRDFTSATVSIDDKTTNLLLDRGLYIRPPYISVSGQVEFVRHQDFMGQFFGDGERKMLAIEIASLFFNIQNNLMGKTLLTGFSQVAQSPDIRRYIVRGIEIANKHIDIFSAILHKEDIPDPRPWDSGVTSSTVAPFSDRLMLQHIITLNQVGLSAYGMAMSECLRKDLLADYGRLTIEIGQYLNDGANIMIENNWMEEPPQIANHLELNLLQ